MAKQFSGNTVESTKTIPGIGSLKTINITCDNPICTKSTVIRVSGANPEVYKLIPVYTGDITPQVTITTNNSSANSSLHNIEFDSEGQVQVYAVPSDYPKDYALFSQLSSINNYSRSVSISCSKPSSSLSNSSTSLNSSTFSVDNDLKTANNLSKCFPNTKPKFNQKPDHNYIKAAYYEEDHCVSKQVNNLYSLAGVSFNVKDNHVDNDLQAITNWIKSLNPTNRHKNSVDYLKGYKTQLDSSNNKWNVWVQDSKNLYSKDRHIQTYQSYFCKTYTTLFNCDRDFSINTPLFYVNSSTTTFKSSCFTIISDINRLNAQYKWDSVDSLYTTRTSTKIDYCSEGLYQYLNKHYVKCDGEVVLSSYSKSEEILTTSSLEALSSTTTCLKDYTVRAHQLVYHQSYKDLYSISKKDSKYISGGESIYSSKESTTIVSGGETYITSYKDIQVSATNILALDGSTVRIGMGASRKVTYNLDTNKFESTSEATGLPPTNTSPAQSASTVASSDSNVPPSIVPTSPSTNTNSVKDQEVKSSIEDIISPKAVSDASSGNTSTAVSELSSKGLSMASSTISKLFSKTDKPKPSSPPNPPSVSTPPPVKPTTLV